MGSGGARWDVAADRATAHVGWNWAVDKANVHIGARFGCPMQLLGDHRGFWKTAVVITGLSLPSDEMPISGRHCALFCMLRSYVNHHAELCLFSFTIRFRADLIPDILEKLVATSGQGHQHYVHMLAHNAKLQVLISKS